MEAGPPERRRGRCVVFRRLVSEVNQLLLPHPLVVCRRDVCSPSLDSQLTRMHRMGATVRELLAAAAQSERKAKLDAGRVDTVFHVDDQVLSPS